MTAARQLSIFDVAPPATDSTVPLQSVAPAPTQCEPDPVAVFDEWYEASGRPFADYELTEGNVPAEEPSGRQLRDAAIAQVEANADADWMARAYAAIMLLCCEEKRHELTSDDVWRILGDDDTPREPRALGAVFRRALASGAIAKTGRVTQSKRRQNHAREIAIWRIS